MDFGSGWWSHVAIICLQWQWSGIGYANVALLHLNWHCCAPGLWGRALSDLIQSGWLNRWLTWWREEVLRTDFKSSRPCTHTKAPFFCLTTSTCNPRVYPQRKTCCCCCPRTLMQGEEPKSSGSGCQTDTGEITRAPGEISSSITAGAQPPCRIVVNT